MYERYGAEDAVRATLDLAVMSLCPKSRNEGKPRGGHPFTRMSSLSCLSGYIRKGNSVDHDD